VSEVFRHIPVLLKEVLRFLDLPGRKIIMDCTVGGGSHAAAVLNELGEDGFLLGIDKDKEALAAAKKTLERTKKRFFLAHCDFADYRGVLKDLGIKKLDGVLLDLGVSSYQFENPERGFSIMRKGPLDMRMDASRKTKAADLVNGLNTVELERILREYGQERKARRIARLISRERRRSYIGTTAALKNLVESVYPKRYRRIHPATRTFQALRIAVNAELDSLKSFLEQIDFDISEGARLCVISFHSLEDRIVKLKFRELAKEKDFRILTKKPVCADREEIMRNPRSRSAKLRVIEKIKSQN
jgi:16S rRNA (cytosine1402-N4)-methyltransferase